MFATQTSQKINAPKDHSDDLSLRLDVGAKIRLWQAGGWIFGLVVWNWQENDLFAIKMEDESIKDAKTYHVDNELWFMEMIRPPSIYQEPIMFSSPPFRLVNPLRPRET